MIRLISIFLVSIIFFFPYSSYSEEYNIFLSFGGNYAIEDFDRDVVEDLDLNYNFDDAIGINLKAGYQIVDYFSVGIDIDILRGFEWDLSEGVPLTLENAADPASILKGVVTASADMDFIVGLAFARLSLPGKFKPYISAGLGLIREDAEVKFSTSLQETSTDYSSFTESDFSTDKDFCGKLSIGFEFRPLDRYSVWTEGNYTAGFGDLDDIRYASFTVGGSIFF